MGRMVARPPSRRLRYWMMALPSSSRSTTRFCMAPPQRGLNGHGVLLRHLQQVGHRTVDMLEASPLGLPHHQLDRLG